MEHSESPGDDGLKLMSLFRRPVALNVTWKDPEKPHKSVRLYPGDSLLLTGDKGAVLKVKFLKSGDLTIEQLVPFLEMGTPLQLRRWADVFEAARG